MRIALALGIPEKTIVRELEDQKILEEDFIPTNIKLGTCVYDSSRTNCKQQVDERDAIEESKDNHTKDFSVLSYVHPQFAMNIKHQLILPWEI